MAEAGPSSSRWLAIGCVAAPALAALTTAALGGAAWVAAGLALLVALPAARVLHIRCLAPLKHQRAQQLLEAERARRAADADRAQRALLAAILERVDEPILATDEQGRIVYASPAAARRLSPAIDPHGQPRIEDALSEADLITLERSCRSRPVDDAPRSLRLTLPDPVGERTRWRVLASRLAVGQGEPAGALLIFRDETALADALRARADFVANASHELRTPLAAIQGAVATLRSVLRDDPEAADRFIAMIDANAERLADIARRLLDLSRLESGAVPRRCEPFDPSKLRRSLDALFAAVCAQRSVSLRIDIDDSLAGFSVDPWRLWLILLNLVDNAIKFSHTGSQVRLNAWRAGERALFTVEDNGVGIPLADQQRVFERFYQADAARSGLDRKGAGLGLAVVKHGVRELGGEIHLESVYGEGTTVRVELPPASVSQPANDADAAGAEADAPQSSGPSLRTIS